MTSNNEEFLTRQTAKRKPKFSKTNERAYRIVKTSICKEKGVEILSSNSLMALKNT
jgi:hypothetical protein